MGIDLIYDATQLANFLTELQRLDRLRLTELVTLRRLTFRAPPNGSLCHNHHELVGVISTITSPVFRELGLEASVLPPWIDRRFHHKWDHWHGVDKYLGGRLAEWEDFRVTLRTKELYTGKTVQM